MSDLLERSMTAGSEVIPEEVERVAVVVAARGLARPGATFAALFMHDELTNNNEFLGTSVRSSSGSA